LNAQAVATGQHPNKEKQSNTGTPNLKPALEMTIPKKMRIDPTKSIISGVSVIFTNINWGNKKEQITFIL
jgi:hypothetical protein